MERTDQAPLLELLNRALARELQVSVQYMLQHGVAAGREMLEPKNHRPDLQTKFVSSNSFYWLPGVTLKKIAIAEMRHAEAISKRIVVLGGELATEPDPITIGETITEMLRNDREQEEGAIALYTHIIDVAGNQKDDVTQALFGRILAEERKHHLAFSNLLA